jgi:hypothetical protein
VGRLKKRIAEGYPYWLYLLRPVGFDRCFHPGSLRFLFRFTGKTVHAPRLATASLELPAKHDLSTKPCSRKRGGELAVQISGVIRQDQ